ncbi:MAG: leucyl/phenylalanyl-tRNA--protein transferase [Thiotrichaceae bacterium]|nr:leucyl/phenylalanyl-tRNA--protein transferase [Thiotrichaceae bacterium]
MNQSDLTLLDPYASDEAFPPVNMAWDQPNGLLAVGGDLSPRRLINAYQAGIFPWFNDDEPIYWWSPDPRAVIYPRKLHITRSLRKTARNKGYEISFDTDFAATVRACAAPRSYALDTWITDKMFTAYSRLHDLGYAHSVEVRNTEGKLVGGLYGVATNGIFSGESMFSLERDTSKLALLALAAHLDHWGYHLIDCQIVNDHLLSLGAEGISRESYIKHIRASKLPYKHEWKTHFDAVALGHWN